MVLSLVVLVVALVFAYSFSAQPTLAEAQSSPAAGANLGFQNRYLTKINGFVAQAAACPPGQHLADDAVTCIDDSSLDGSGNPLNPTPTPTPDFTRCPAGYVLDSTGQYCEPFVADATPTPDPSNRCTQGYVLDPHESLCVTPTPVGQPSTSIGDAQCPPGQVLDVTRQYCQTPEEKAAETKAKDQPCPPGQTLGDDGKYCVKETPTPVSNGAQSCSSGLVLSPDGKTCVKEGDSCPQGKVLNEKGNCVSRRKCADGLLLGSDLLTCTSRCESNELVSVDGSRCVAKNDRCPDGSLRPQGGACLTVVREGDEILVRCAPADQYCQARVKQCVQARGGGPEAVNECSDPRKNCSEDDEACQKANQRIIDCASVEDIENKTEACDALCPEFHRLGADGSCEEYLDPLHPCVLFNAVPRGVVTNEALRNFSYLAGTGQCVTRVEFLRRLDNFEAAAGAEADALNALRATTSEYLTVEGQIAELEQRMQASELRIQELQVLLAETDERRIATEQNLVLTRERLAEERETLSGQVLEYFVAGGDHAIIAAALKATSISEIAITQAYGELVIQDTVETIDVVSQLEQATEQLNSEIAQIIADSESQLAEASNRRSDIQSLLADAEQLYEEQEQRRIKEAELVAELREDKADTAQALGIFEQDTRLITEILSESEFIVTELQLGDGVFSNPVSPAVVTSGFGPRLHPILGYIRMHNGLDFQGKFGDPIRASAPGTAKVASNFGGYGNTVVIDHGGGLVTLYAHMQSVGVEVGEEVERGDIIGIVGSTGLSTGPHLHFEVWLNGSTAVDPLPYLPSNTVH